jgi:hypothetical protein
LQAGGICVQIYQRTLFATINWETTIQINGKKELVARFVAKLTRAIELSQIGGSCQTVLENSGRREGNPLNLRNEASKSVPDHVEYVL